MALRAARANTHPHGRRATNGRDPFISLSERGQMKRDGRELVSVDVESASEGRLGLGVRVRVVVSWRRKAETETTSELSRIGQATSEPPTRSPCSDAGVVFVELTFIDLM